MKRFQINIPLRRAGMATLVAGFVLAAGPGQAQSADPATAIAARKTGYGEIGAAFKTVNDELRKPKPLAIVLTRSTATIKKTAPRAANWFPAGSGPAPGVKTSAKAEIWTKKAEFDAIQARFLVNVDKLDKLAAAGDMKALQAQARVVGGDCKACHDKFRTPQD